ncbi:MAG: hypothetical protein QM754_18480 [Tepidisphaeraceae bacterium]
MSTVTLTATVAGKPLAGMNVTKGQTLVVDVAPSGPIDGLNIASTNAGIKTLAYDSKAPWQMTFVVPEPNDKGQVNLQIEARKSGGQAGLLKLAVNVSGDTGNAPASLPPRWGVACNDKDSTAAILPAFKLIKADGATFIRCWHSNFGQISAANVALIAAANAAGLGVILCVQPKDSETAVVNLGSPDYVKFVTLNRATLANVDYVEAGNELNLKKYRPDDLGGEGAWYGSYVERWLKPLSVALAAVGVKTLLASVTESETLDDYAVHAKGFAAAGAAKYCVGAAIHCYVYLNDKANVVNVSDLAGLLTSYSKTMGLPLFVTEANLHKSVGSGDAYVAAVPSYIKALQLPCVSAILWYRAAPSSTPSNNSSGRPLVDGVGKPTPLYAVAKKALGL